MCWIIPPKAWFPQSRGRHFLPPYISSIRCHFRLISQVKGQAVTDAWHGPHPHRAASTVVPAFPDCGNGRDLEGVTPSSSIQHPHSRGRMDIAGRLCSVVCVCVLSMLCMSLVCLAIADEGCPTLCGSAFHGHPWRCTKCNNPLPLKKRRGQPAAVNSYKD